MKLPFFHTETCLDGHFCRQCRDRVGGRKFRVTWAKNHETPDGKVDFPCGPRGLKFTDEAGAEGQTFPDPPRPGANGVPENRAGGGNMPAGGHIPAANRQSPTLSMMAAWALAATMGKWATAEAVAERNEICARCPYARQDAKGRYCSICGCGTHSEAKALKNLAAYAENMPGHPDYDKRLPVWGCKHPKRGQMGPDGRKMGWPLPVLTNSGKG